MDVSAFNYDYKEYASDKEVLVRAHDVHKTYDMGTYKTYALKGIEMETVREEFIKKGYAVKE